MIFQFLAAPKRLFTTLDKGGSIGRHSFSQVTCYRIATLWMVFFSFSHKFVNFWVFELPKKSYLNLQAENSILYFKIHIWIFAPKIATLAYMSFNKMDVNFISLIWNHSVVSTIAITRWSTSRWTTSSTIIAATTTSTSSTASRLGLRHRYWLRTRSCHRWLRIEALPIWRTGSWPQWTNGGRWAGSSWGRRSRVARSTQGASEIHVVASTWSLG